MTSKLQNGGRLPLHGPALALVIGVLCASPAPAGDGPGVVHRHPAGPCGKPGCPGHAQGSGFQGFGAGYHLGYGYGGRALGVGPFGGYPFYGGPGYPHGTPALRRHRGIVPFAYYGGPGGPTACAPNYYGGVGPLAVDPPVVTAEAGAGNPADYGPFSGAIPYPETLFAPFSTDEPAAPAGPRPGFPPTPPSPSARNAGGDPRAVRAGLR